MEGWGGFNGYIYVIVLSNIGMFVRITFLQSGTSTLPYKTVKSYFDIIYDYFFSETRDVTKMILTRKWNLKTTSTMQQKSQVQDISKDSDH